MMAMHEPLRPGRLIRGPGACSGHIAGITEAQGGGGAYPRQGRAVGVVTDLGDVAVGDDVGRFLGARH